MARLKDIPTVKLEQDSHFYRPVRELTQAVEQYYKREHGVSPTSKQVKNQIKKILENYYD